MKKLPEILKELWLYSEHEFGPCFEIYPERDILLALNKSLKYWLILNNY